MTPSAAPGRLIVVALSLYVAVTGVAVVVGGLGSIGPEARPGWRLPLWVGQLAVVVQAAVWFWWRGRLFARPAWAAVFQVATVGAAAADPSGIAMLQLSAGAFVAAATLTARRAAALVGGGVAVLAAVEAAGAPGLPALTFVGFAALLAALCLLSFTFGRVHRALLRSIEELRASGDRVRDLSLQQERTRTAGELHDGLGHQLTALGMQLNVAESLREQAPEQAWRTVAQANALAGAALQDLRRWVRALGSPRPGDAWGPDAVASVVAGFASTTLDVRLEVTGRPVPLPEVAEVTVFRAVQEALANVVKHADARRVLIGMVYGADGLVLTVDDDGVGFDGPIAGSVQRGFGLRSLQARVADFGGDFAVGSGPLGGCRVTLRCPSVS